MKKTLTLLFALSLATSASAEDAFSLTTGLDYSSGKYGNATATDMLYIPVTAKYAKDEWTLKLTVPYISVSGPGGVIRGMGRTDMMASASSGGGMGGGGSGGTATNTHSGLGDVIASAGHTMYSTTNLELDLVGNIKFGTANANLGLGTGKNDYSMQLDSFYTISDSMLFTTLGYKKFGVPAGTSLNNIFYGSIGSSTTLDNDTTAGISMDMAQRTSTLGANQVSASVFASEKFASGFKVMANIAKGFADGSPDFEMSLMVSKMY